MLDRFKDYNCRVFYSKSVFQKEWRVQQFDSYETVWSATYMRPECFWSIRRYTEDALNTEVEELSNLDSVAPFVLDLDWHDSSLSFRCLVDGASRVSTWIVKTLKVKPTNLMIWFSGRGFHIITPSELLLDSPSSCIERDYEKLALYLERHLGLIYPARKVFTSESVRHDYVEDIRLIDMGIYKPKKLLRVPGSVNPKSKFKRGISKFRIPYETLMTLARKDSKSLQQSFRELIKQPCWEGAWWL